jgi:NTP pyrophosphatase (non-canonical NTP hydrolase)
MSCKEQFLKELADKNADLTNIYKEAFSRYENGKEKYGTYNPFSDKRDMKKEMRDELIDVINYAAMFILKIDKLG